MSVEGNGAGTGACGAGVCEKKMAATLIPEQKFMISVLWGITVDRANDVLECRLLRVPKIESPVLKSVFQSRAVQSSMCPEQDLNLHDLTATSS